MRNTKGSILIEACLATALVLTALVMNIELVRRCRIEILTHHMAFLFSRGRALGKSRGHLLEAARGFPLGPVKITEEQRAERGVGVKVHHEYGSFLRFSYQRGTKKRFEVTRECWFRY